MNLTCNKSQIFLLLEVFFIKQELPINRQIRAKEVQLIGETGEKLGVLSLNEALAKADKLQKANDEAYEIADKGKYWFKSSMRKDIKNALRPDEAEAKKATEAAKKEANDAAAKVEDAAENVAEEAK